MVNAIHRGPGALVTLIWNLIWLVGDARDALNIIYSQACVANGFACRFYGENAQRHVVFPHYARLTHPYDRRTSLLHRGHSGHPTIVSSTSLNSGIVIPSLADSNIAFTSAPTDTSANFAPRMLL